MRIKREYIFYFLWLLFFLYGIDNYIFERKFFFNEILSLVGLVIFLSNVVFQSKENRFKIPDNKIYKLTLFIIGLGVIHLCTSIFRATNIYFYLRNSVIVYSIFAFFFGYYAFQYLPAFIKKIRLPLWLYLIFALIYPAIYLLERFMGAVFFPFLFKRRNWLAQIGIIIFSIALSIRYESLTVLVVTVIIPIIFLLPSYKIFKYLSVVGFVALIASFIYFAPYFEKYKTPPYAVIGNVEAVAASHPALNVDGNSTWRSVFWYRVVKERFPENVLGIGFGTPILRYKKGYDTIPIENDDEHDMHVTGVHNTYLTLAIRMGLVFLVLITLVFREVFQFFYKNKKYLANKERQLYFYSFFTLVTVGLFNLVLESPTGASLFWGLLGVIAAIVNEAKESVES